METGTDHPNAALVRRGMEAFDRGDPGVFGELIAEDVVWHQIGAPTLHGRSEMEAAQLGGEVDWQITTEVHDVVANDEHVIALVRAHATRGDRTLDYRTAEIMHVRDGKITERWAFADDTQRIVEFFA